MARKKTFNIDVTLDIAGYIVTTQDIASAYFDEKYNYQPYIGDLNAMRIFYAVCVKDSPYEDVLLHEEDDLSKFEDLFADESFIGAFNNAITQDSSVRALTFTNAYQNAMEMVEAKKGTAERVVNYLSYALEDLAQKVVPTMSPENLDKVREISKDIKEGRISASAVADAYSNTKRYKDVIEGKS